MAKILCVEDEHALLDDLVEELEDAGHEALTAANGQEGLDVILKERPDMVLCDISMPVMDGFQLLNELRSNYDEFAELPFVFLSALADRKQVIEGKALGADDYITKPVDYDLLLATIDARLRQVARMAGKKEREMITLYKALAAAKEETDHDQGSSQSSDSASTASPAASEADSGSVGNTGMPKPSGGKMVTGRFMLLGLDEIREKLGDKWERYEENVLTTIKHAVDKKLAPEDVFRQTENNDFMICFASLTESEAAFKLEAIKQEIWGKLLGEEAAHTELLEFESQTFEIEVSEEEMESAADPWDLINQRVKEAEQKVIESVDTLIREMVDLATVVPRSVVNAAGEKLPLSIADFDEDGRDRYRQIHQVLDREDPKLMQAELIYLASVIEFLLSNLVGMSSACIVVKLSYPSCANKKSFEKILQLLEGLVPKAREKLIISLCRIPNKIHPSKLSDIVIRLRPFARMCAVDLKLPIYDHPGFEQISASIYTMDYHETEALLRHNNNKLKKVIGELRRKKKHILVDPVPKKSMKALTELGVDFIGLSY